MEGKGEEESPSLTIKVDPVLSDLNQINNLNPTYFTKPRSKLLLSRILYWSESNCVKSDTRSLRPSIHHCRAILELEALLQR